MTAELLTIKAAAERLGIGKDLLYKLCALEEFPHVKIGSRIRIVASDIPLWIAANKRGAACFNGSARTASLKAGSTSTKIQ